MNRQEHNRNWEANVAWKKKDLTPITFPHIKTISVIVHKLPRKGFISIKELTKKKHVVREKLQWLRFV